MLQARLPGQLVGLRMSLHSGLSICNSFKWRIKPEGWPESDLTHVQGWQAAIGAEGACHISGISQR